MKKNLLKNVLSILLFLSISSIKAQLPDGFAVWSEGDAGQRTITMRTLKSDGTMGEPKKVVNKGDKGGDIESQISFDGKWLAFARSLGCRNRYGGDDYHEFDKWDLYVVPLDGTLPATPQKVGRGYWPSWSDDSRNAKKTLYYCTHGSASTIRKVTVDDNGILSGSDAKVYDIPKKIPGKSGEFVGFAMMAPNGKFMAWRGSGVCLYFFEDWMGNKAKTGYESSAGCMPSITADSRWVFNAYNCVTRVGKKSVKTGKGQYHFGSSTDLNWYICRTKGGAQVQNKGYDVSIFSVKIKGEEASKHFDDPADFTSKDYGIADRGVSITSKGSWPDIHVTADATSTSKPDINIKVPTKSVNISVELNRHHLIVKNGFSESLRVSVFNLYGKKIESFQIQKPGVASLKFKKKLSNGFYFIRIKNSLYQDIIKIRVPGYEY
jgi:hypothetical protein